MSKTKLLESFRRRRRVAPVARKREAVPDAELMTAEEFARFCRCSLRTLDRERATGRGCPYVRLGARILYRRPDAERYIEENVRGPKQEP
jgi:hypothetical protein